MKTYVLHQIHTPSTFEPVGIVQGRTDLQASSAAWGAAKNMMGSVSYSDTEWTEVTVHWYCEDTGDLTVLFTGSVLDLADSDIAPGEYPVCTNPLDPRDRSQTWRVWIDQCGVKRAGHRHI
jgi:hypothetical protein